MVKRLRKYRFLNCILMSLFIGFYVSNTLFLHTHYYQGHAVTHSHPYAKNSEGLPDHTHSTNDLRVISAFNASVYFPAETVLLEDVCRIPVVVRTESGSSVAVAGVHLHYGMRAPPVRSV